MTKRILLEQNYGENSCLSYWPYFKYLVILRFFCFLLFIYRSSRMTTKVKLGEKKKNLSACAWNHFNTFIKNHRYATKASLQHWRSVFRSEYKNATADDSSWVPLQEFPPAERRQLAIGSCPPDTTLIECLVSVGVQKSGFCCSNPGLFPKSQSRFKILLGFAGNPSITKFQFNSLFLPVLLPSILILRLKPALNLCLRPFL